MLFRSNRETEAMRDGSDAIADWPVLNALLNTSSGATWVSVHHGGGASADVDVAQRTDAPFAARNTRAA